MVRVLVCLLALVWPVSALGQGTSPSTSQSQGGMAVQQSLLPTAGAAYLPPAATPLQLGANIPIPDPSILTTQQLYREILLARQFNTQEVEALRKVLETRLDAIDTATDLRIKPIEELSAVISDSIENLQALQDEKFKSIETQFAERDIRTEQAANQSKTAIDAALQAQKEAVAEQNRSSSEAIAKNETSTTKLIDGIVTLIQSSDEGNRVRFDDLKERITAVENIARGSATAKENVYGGMNAVIGIGIAVAGLVISAAVVMLRRPEPHRA